MGCGHISDLRITYLMGLRNVLTGCTKPVLYLSANMRSVLLPADTQAGTVIYRLRASDADDEYPISFGVVGESIFGLVLHLTHYPFIAPVTHLLLITASR